MPEPLKAPLLITVPLTDPPDTGLACVFIRYDAGGDNESLWATRPTNDRDGGIVVRCGERRLFLSAEALLGAVRAALLEGEE